MLLNVFFFRHSCDKIIIQDGDFVILYVLSTGFPGGSVANNSPANSVDTGVKGFISGFERYPGKRNDNPL